MLGPGTYNIETGDFDEPSIGQKSQGPNWERGFEVAKLAAIPHMLYQKQWKHKKLLVCRLGKAGH